VLLAVYDPPVTTKWWLFLAYKMCNEQARNDENDEPWWTVSKKALPTVSAVIP